MINELDTVVLTRDIGEHGLERGDVGAVVHRYADGGAFEVEFITAEGSTVALLTLSARDLRPVGRNDLLHVRELMPA